MKFRTHKDEILGLPLFYMSLVYDHKIQTNWNGGSTNKNSFVLEQLLRLELICTNFLCWSSNMMFTFAYCIIIAEKSIWCVLLNVFFTKQTSTVDHCNLYSEWVVKTLAFCSHCSQKSSEVICMLSRFLRLIFSFFCIL